MIYATTHFTMPNANLGDYDRLYNVFAESVRQNGGGHPIAHIAVDPPGVKRHMTASLEANHAKMLAWQKYIETIDDDVVLIDCDMLVMRDFSEAFVGSEWDVAITRRTAARMPINGGVVMVRNTARAKAFIKAWAEADTLLYNNHQLHAEWRRKWRGMNQASLGYLLSTDYPGVVERVRCSTYNACEEDWPKVDVKNPPYAIHCKAHLKRRVLSKDSIDRVEDKYRSIVALWRAYEAIAKNNAERYNKTST